MIAIGKYIVVEKSTDVEEAGSGLEYSEVDTNQMRGHRGTVIIAGTDVSGIKPGDVVYYDKARSFDQAIEGRTYTMTREMDIMVVISSS